MRVAHLECSSGISGDMTLAALVSAGVPFEAIAGAIASLGLPITLTREQVKRSGIAATKIQVHAEDQKNHRHLPEIEALIRRAAITERQRDLALKIFHKLAIAEAAVHGIPLEKVHFHEVGALDSIADIIGCAVGLDHLGVAKFTCSPVAPGSGTIECDHGVMPVPAPATLELLKGVPLAPSRVKTELVTPTGAAILAAIVSEYLDTPPMKITAIGLGAGTKDFREQPNLLRLFVGESTQSHRDHVWVLETNLDDVAPEIIGYCVDELFRSGALDVTTSAIQMKKQRPGVLLRVIARDAQIQELESILFRETGTLGVRRSRWERAILPRESASVSTPWGEVRVKLARRGDEILRTPEYDDCARVAREQGIPLRKVYEEVLRAKS